MGIFGGKKPQAVKEQPTLEEDRVVDTQGTTPKDLFKYHESRFLADDELWSLSDDEKKDVLGRFYDKFGTQYLNEVGITDKNKIKEFRTRYVEDVHKRMTEPPKKKESLEEEYLRKPGEFFGAKYKEWSEIKKLEETEKGEELEKNINQSIQDAISQGVMPQRIVNVLENQTVSTDNKKFQIVAALRLQNPEVQGTQALKLANEITDTYNDFLLNKNKAKSDDEYLTMYNHTYNRINELLEENNLPPINTNERGIITEADYPGLAIPSPIQGKPSLFGMQQTPKQKEEEPSTASRLGGAFAKGSAALGQGFARVPAFTLDLLYAPQNLIAEKTGWDWLKAQSPEWLKNNPAAKYYDDQVQTWDEKMQLSDLKIVDEFKEGNIKEGFENIALMVAETLPLTISLMAGGFAQAGTGANILTQTARTAAPIGMYAGAQKKHELDKNYPELSEFTKTYNALMTGTGEGLSESLGTISIGRLGRDLMENMGKEAFEKAMKGSSIEMLYKRLGKSYILTGAIGEGTEEIVAGVIENLTDKFTGVDPDRRIFEGTADQFIVGFFAGGLTTTPIELATRAARKAEDKMYKEYVTLKEGQIEGKPLPPDITFPKEEKPETPPKKEEPKAEEKKESEQPSVEAGKQPSAEAVVAPEAEKPQLELKKGEKATYKGSDVIIDKATTDEVIIYPEEGNAVQDAIYVPKEEIGTELVPREIKEKLPSEMTIEELESESEIFTQKIKNEKARLDKADPDRQIFSGAGLSYLSDKDVQRYTSINDEIDRRGRISSEEAKKRVTEKREQRKKEPEKKPTVEKAKKPVKKTKPKKKRATPKRITKVLSNDPQSIREAILQYFIGGGRVKTSSFKAGLQGKGKEMASKAIHFLSEKEGRPIDTLYETFQSTFGAEELQSMDFPNMVYDVINQHSSIWSMVEEVEKLHKGMEQGAETDIPVPEDEADIVNFEAEQDNKTLTENPQFVSIIQDFIKDDEIDFDAMEKLIESDPAHFTMFPFGLTDTELNEFKTIIKDENNREKIREYFRGFQDLFGEEISLSDRIAEDGDKEGITREQAEPKLTEAQQAVLDKRLKEIDEELLSKDKALKEAKKQRRSKINELDERHGLFGDTKAEPGRLIDGEFVYTDETVKKALKPIDEKIYKTEKDIEQLKKLRDDTIKSAGQQGDLFRTMERPVKIDEKGGKTISKHGLSNKELTGVRHKLKGLALQVGTDIKIVDKQSELPQSLQKKIGDKVVYGVHSAGQTWFVMENMPSMEEAIVTFMHEVGVHAGITKLIPDEFERAQFFNQLVDDIGLDRIREVVGDDFVEAYQNGQLEKYVLGEEFMAYLADQKLDPNTVLSKKEQAWWDRFINKINELLTKVFNFETKITEADVLKVAEAAIQASMQAQETGSQVLSPDGTPRFKVVGEVGATNLDRAEEATTRMDNLRVAREMETSGKDAKAIKLATGWERGADKLWRYEVADDQMYYNFPEILTALDEGKYYVSAANDYVLSKTENEALTGKRKGVEIRTANTVVYPLEQVLGKDSDTFKAYPTLRNAKVVFDNSLPASSGFWSPSNQEIHISLLQPDADEVRNILIHELQHAIQEREGFAKGGSMDSITKMAAELFDKTAISGDMVFVTKVLNSLYGKREQIERAIIKSHEGTVKDKEIIQSLYGPINELRKTLKLIDDFTDAIESRSHEKAYDIYKRLAGEVESRNVQLRSVMSTEMRRETLLSETEDVAREDQIFLQENLGEARSEESTQQQSLPFEDRGQIYLRRVPKQKNTLQADDELRMATGKRIEKGWFDSLLRRGLTNNMIAVQRFQEKILELGGKIRDLADVHSLENLFHSKVVEKISDYDKLLIKPFTKAVAEFQKAGNLTDRERIKYMHCKHTPERMETFINRRVKEMEAELETKIQDIEKNKAREIDKVTKEIAEDPLKYTPDINRVDEVLEGLINDIETQAENRINDLIEESTDNIETFKEEAKNNVYTGYSLTEAEEYVKEIEGRIKDKKVITDLWDATRKISKEICDNWYTYDRIDAETYDEIVSRWQYFVPLRGWEKDETTGVFDYETLSGEYISSFYPMKGRMTKPDDPQPYLVSMLFNSLIEGERNEISKAAGRLINDNADVVGDLAGGTVVYQVDIGKKNPDGSIAYDEWIERPPQEYFDQGKVKVAKHNPTKQKKPPSQAKEHLVQFYLDGQKYALWFQDNAVSKAINNLHGKELTRSLGWLTSGWSFKLHSFPTLSGKRDVVIKIPGMGNITRFMSQNFTARNLNFLVVNPVRDIPLAALTQFVEGTLMDAPTLMKYLAIAQPVIYRSIKGQLDMNNKYDKMFEDWRLGGGRTGIVRNLDIETIRKRLENNIKEHTKETSIGEKIITAPWEIAKGTAEIFEMLSGWSEDMTRFAVYMQSIESGKTQQRALINSKNSSVNFNKKGEWTPVMGSLWAFFNAQAQGVVKIGQLHKTDWKKMAAVETALIAQGFLMAALYDIFGDGDDDKEDETGLTAYDRLFDHEKYNNLHIPGTKLKVPLPHILRWFNALGVISYDAIRNVKLGRKDKNDAIMDALLMAMSEFPQDMSPWDFGGFINKDGQFTVRPFVPTAAIPFYDLAVNEDWTKRRIYKEPYMKEDIKYMAKSQAYFKDTNTALIKFTNALYKLKGGDIETAYKFYYDQDKEKMKKVPFWGDINPAWIEHTAEGYFGGMGKFFNDVWKTGEGVLKSATEVTEDKRFKEAVQDNVRLTDVPMLQRFISRPYRDIKQEFWIQEREVLQSYRKLYNRYVKVENFAKAEEMRSVFTYDRMRLFETMEDIITTLDDRIYEETDRDQIKELKKAKNKVIDRYVDYIDQVTNELKQIQDEKD